MNKTGSFLSDLLGKNYNSDTINEYASRLRNHNQIPFVHFTEEGLENELLVFSNSQNNNAAINSQKEAESMDAESSLMGVYEDLEYPLKRGPFFYASNYELNYNHRTWIIFTQDGLIFENPEGIMEPNLYPWDSWKEVLYTKHAKLDAPVILLASPNKSGVPEISISPILTIDKNIEISIEASGDTSSAIEAKYSALVLAEMNFAYQTLKRFWKVVDQNRNSDYNEISSTLLSLIHKKDFKIFQEIQEE